MLPTLVSLNNSTQYLSGELPANKIQQKKENVQKKDFVSKISYRTTRQTYELTA